MYFKCIEHLKIYCMNIVTQQLYTEIKVYLDQWQQKHFLR